MTHMTRKKNTKIKTSLLKDHVNKYAILGLILSVMSILVASLIVSYQLTGAVTLYGFILAQKSNPAIWALDLTPFLFAYWGQEFCYELANKAEMIIEDKARKFAYETESMTSKIQYESLHDPLTNLPNDRLFFQRLHQAMNNINQHHLAIILIKIHNYEEINYNFGLFGANSVLVQIAEKFKSILLEPYMLQSDMGMNLVSRIQGSEFALLLPKIIKEHHLDAGGKKNY